MIKDYKKLHKIPKNYMILKIIKIINIKIKQIFYYKIIYIKKKPFLSQKQINKIKNLNIV